MWYDWDDKVEKLERTFSKDDFDIADVVSKLNELITYHNLIVEIIKELYEKSYKANNLKKGE